MVSKVLTLRLPSDAYERATALAKRRGQSLNRLFQEGLLLLDEQEREKRLFDDFSVIGAADEGGADVEFALEAQSQAIAGS